MLKLFASQRNSAAVLLRACLPSAASRNPGNTHILKNFRRSMSDDCHLVPGARPSAVTLASKGYYHIWSLISNQGDALIEIVNLVGENGPTFQCTGMFDENTSLVDMTDSTVFPTPSVSFRMTLSGTHYYLSLEDGKVVARALKREDDPAQDRERFVHLIHGSYSMFENVTHRNCYLGSYKDGSLGLVNVHDKLFPDPRVLFLMHSKLIRKPT